MTYQQPTVFVRRAMDHIETVLSAQGHPVRVTYIGFNAFEGEQFQVPLVLQPDWAAAIGVATGAQVDLVPYPAAGYSFFFLRWL